MGKRINVLAGGPKEKWPDDIFEQNGDWIGADRGAYHLLKAGLPMVAAVGDFDSLDEGENVELHDYLKDDQIKVYPPKKDYTDTQIALLAAFKHGATDIVLYGATGGRLDHELSNLTIPTQDEFKHLAGHLSIVDNQNTITYLDVEHQVVNKQPGYKYLGFMPLGIVDNFKIIDALYPLTLSVNSGKMYSSNEFVGELVHTDFDCGIVLVTQSNG
ncbi:thiamine diphosphokinase [Fructobacillus sp. M2-14]|uniref:Thiamine diphosphokinase n=1 Tax=Fructobacillus broussonetiae TaxID=2713173 RepID=A0ABS5QZ04_9LACO|nr:thiamine diphosphokinase [Fructobacillus broussonetiae]MBS9338428.1 thiamine diphosphokinase [Fructobacillus broussonetiae]